MAPELDTAAFPDDVETLRALLAQRDAAHCRARGSAGRARRRARKAGFEIEKLKVQLAALRREHYGQSSEKLAAETDQLEMLIGDLEENQAERQAAAAEKAAPDQGANPATSASLPRAGRCPSICRARLWCTSPSSPVAAAAPIPPA